MCNYSTSDLKDTNLWCSLRYLSEVPRRGTGTPRANTIAGAALGTSTFKPSPHLKSCNPALRPATHLLTKVAGSGLSRLGRSSTQHARAVFGLIELLVMCLHSAIRDEDLE